MYLSAAISVKAFAAIYFGIASADVAMSLVMLMASIQKKNTKETLIYGTLAVLSLISLAQAYNLNCSIRATGDKGSISFEYDSSNPDTISIGEGSSSFKDIIVTEDVIRNAMKDAPLKTQQKAVSIPVIQNYVDRVLAGETNIPNIKVDGDIIMDGNHRYITSRITGIDIDIQAWIGGNPDNVISWDDVILDSTDWGNR